jgi:ribonucleoside-diphosphate reductase alpha chain
MRRERGDIGRDAPLAPIAEHVWRTRYRCTEESNQDQAIGATWHRVARAAAALESEPSVWATRFEAVLAELKFLPGGRILAGAGTMRAVTLANCFVMGPIEDSIAGIFETLKEAAVTLQHGGGVGFDLSSLRPRGTLARSNGTQAAGPVAFLPVFDAVCATLATRGPRGGAMMATLSCAHPDVGAFIRAKLLPGALPHFNLSVQITNDFMRAVTDDTAWPLRFQGEAPAATHETLRARALWQDICAAAHASAEPGVLFVDRINALNNLAYRETLTATNPCGEAPLPPYGACHLGSLNLPRFVVRPFTADATLDLASLADVARTASRFLDNVIDISRYPLRRQAERARASRRIGLGVTGLGDMLAMLSLHYDSDAARMTAANALRIIRDAAYEASIELARERGAFPELDVLRHLERPFIASLPSRLQDALRLGGIRNSHLLAIAPAGAISLLAGNVSSGIEPIAALSGVRKVADSSADVHSLRLDDYAYQLWEQKFGDTQPLPATFVTANQVTGDAQLAMQAALQSYVDGAVSKTIVLPRDATAHDIDRLFRRAFDLGVKGCTVYRAGSRPDVLGVDASDCVAATCAPRAAA